MLRNTSLIPTLLLTALLLGACSKYQDPHGPDDPRLNRPYCNDPEAVNYNWDFPGRPNDSVCIYPSGLFSGTYSFTDSVYFADESLDTNGTFSQLRLQIYALGKSRLALTGFCGPDDTLFFTADRYYKATADTILFNSGQPMCRLSDTLTGTIYRARTDSSLRLDLRVQSDTGLNFHRGTALKQ